MPIQTILIKDALDLSGEWVKKGTKVEVLSKDGDFYRVQYARQSDAGTWVLSTIIVTAEFLEHQNMG